MSDQQQATAVSKRAQRSELSSSSGFTLIELVLALSILATAGLSIQYLSTEAVQRTREFTLNSKMQRMARQKLDEIVYGIEQEISGTFEKQNQMSWEFSASTMEAPQYETDLSFVECRLVLTFEPDETKDPETMEFQTWVFVPQNDPLLELAEQAANIEADDLNSNGGR